LERKNEQIFTWLDLPVAKRPQIIAAYVSEVDSAGHLTGPDSASVNDALRQVDTMIGDLFEGLARRNLTDVINVMVVSDHGMTASSRHRLIYYDDLLYSGDLEYVGITEAWPLLGIRPTDPTRLPSIYEALKRASKKKDSHFEVYLRPDIPERFHFSATRRVPDILAIPEIGWSFVTHEEFDKEGELDYQPKGIHGFDNLEPDMHALFVASGPGFVARSPEGMVKRMKTGTVKGFINTEVYGILARVLGLRPAPNNGTLCGVFEEAA